MNMTETQKKKMLRLLNKMASGFGDYQEGKDECGDKFWGAWSSMQDFINKLSAKKEA